MAASATTPVVTKLANGQDVWWLGIGDSTYYGVTSDLSEGQAAYSGGWVPEFGIKVGTLLGATVITHDLGTSGPGAGGVRYTPPAGTGNGGTLHMVRCGGPGMAFADALVTMRGGGLTGMAATPPDLVITWMGINDLGFPGKTIPPSALGPRAEEVVVEIRNHFGATPKIIIADENATAGLSYNTGYSMMFDHFSDQSSLPLIPVIIPGTDDFPNLWCLDSHQGFGVMGTLDPEGFGAKWMSDGLHPNMPGYHHMAQWMFETLIQAADTGPDPDPGEDPGDPDAGVPFVADTITRIRIKLAGHWYPVKVLVNVTNTTEDPAILAAATLPATLPFVLPALGSWRQANPRS